jgi:hypothetical protein
MIQRKRDMKTLKSKGTIMAQDEEIRSLKINENGLKLEKVDDMIKVGQMVIKSGLAPTSFDNPQKIVIALLAGKELGLKPWQSLQQLHVVNGKVGISGQMMAGLIRSSNTCEYLDMIHEGEGDSLKAIVKSKRPHEDCEHKTIFSVQDAKTAGLWQSGNAWKKYPHDMLMWRAIARHSRYFYSDVLGGIYATEELEYIPDPAYDVQTPKREDRKPVEVTIQPEIAEQLEALMTKYVNLMSDCDLENIPGEFAGYCEKTLAMENLRDPSLWTQDMVDKIKESLGGSNEPD